MQKCQNGHKLTRAWSNLVFWLCCCTGVTRTLTCSIFTCWRNLGVWLRCHQNWFPGPLEQLDPLAGFWNNLASWEDFNYFPQLEQSKFKIIKTVSSFLPVQLHILTFFKFHIDYENTLRSRDEIRFDSMGLWVGSIYDLFVSCFVVLCHAGM